MIIKIYFKGMFKYNRANDGERTIGHSFKVRGLDADTDYEFRIAAENRAGVGPFSEITTPIRMTQPEGKVHYYLYHL
jgi:titin